MKRREFLGVAAAGLAAGVVGGISVAPAAESGPATIDVAWWGPIVSRTGVGGPIYEVVLKRRINGGSWGIVQGELPLAIGGGVTLVGDGNVPPFSVTGPDGTKINWYTDTMSLAGGP